MSWRGENVKYYGFTDAGGTEKLLLLSCKSTDASVKAMLEAALDHAAETFRLN